MPVQQMECAACRVGSATIYGPTFSAGPDKVAALRRKTVRARPRQIVHDAGQTQHFVYTVQSGWACRFRKFADGRRQIVAFLLPGDTVNAEAATVDGYAPPFVVMALTDLVLCAFEPDAIRAIIRSTDAQRACFANHVIPMLRFAEQRLADLGRRRAVGRIAQLVLDLDAILRARGLVTGDAFEFPLRQEDIADAVGLTPSHVNRTLAGLRESGVLDIRHGRLTLFDRKALVDIAAAE